MICGVTGRYREHLPHVFKIVGLREGVHRAAALSMLIMPKGTYFICDTHVNPGPAPRRHPQINPRASTSRASALGGVNTLRRNKGDGTFDEVGASAGVNADGAGYISAPDQSPEGIAAKVKG